MKILLVSKTNFLNELDVNSSGVSLLSYVNDFESAMNQLISYDFDVVVYDWNLYGEELLRQIRISSVNKINSVSIVVLLDSISLTESLELEMLSWKVKTWLFKPILPNHLVKKLKEILAN